MIWKILPIFVVFLSVEAQDPSIRCNYTNIVVEGVQRYTCNAVFNNPDGFDGFTSILGDHLEGMTDADVTYISRSSGNTTLFPQIICNQFPNLVRISVSSANIGNLSNNPFANCRNIEWLRLWNNPLNQLPDNIFSNNPALVYLDLDNTRLASLPVNVFGGLESLVTLELRNNPLVNVPDGVFRSLIRLENLYLNNCGLSSFRSVWFAPMISLRSLWLYNNNLTTVEFPELNNLTTLDLQNNQIANLQSGNFRSLRNLITLYLSRNGIRELTADVFDGLSNLSTLYLNFNLIEDLPENVFASLANLQSLGLWGNRIKTINRHYFGNLNFLRYIDLDDNVINAFERSVFDDAANLQTLFFWNNLCASGSFTGINLNRTNAEQRLARCFRNHEFIIETTTEGGNLYRFFSFPQPGISLRVTASQDAHISLNPVNFPAVPSIEIYIGAHNNTRSIIRKDGSENVVDISTPGILNGGSWTGFRVVFANWMVLVFREGETFPFMAYNMEEFYPINFYGIRAPGNTASWYIQPIES